MRWRRMRRQSERPTARDAMSESEMDDKSRKSTKKKVVKNKEEEGNFDSIWDDAESID